MRIEIIEVVEASFDSETAAPKFSLMAALGLIAILICRALYEIKPDCLSSKEGVSILFFPSKYNYKLIYTGAHARCVCQIHRPIK